MAREEKARKPKIMLKTLRAIVSHGDEKLRMLTLRIDDFAPEAWECLLREAARTAEFPELKYDVTGYVCPVQHGGCGKIRAFALQDAMVNGVHRVGLACISCGKRYRLKGPGDGTLKLVKMKKGAKKKAKKKSKA